MAWAMAHAPVSYGPRSPGLTNVVVVAISFSLPISRLLPTSALSLLICAYLVGMMAIFRARMPFGGLWWPLASLLAAGATFVASYQSDDVLSSVIIGGQIVVMLGVAPFALRWIATEAPRAVVQGAVAFTLAQTVSSAAALYQASGGRVLNIGSLFGRAPGLAGHPNVLGVYASLAFFLALTYLLRHESARRAVAVIAMINLGALIASGSLSSLISFGLALFLYSRAHGTQWRTYVKTGIGLVAAIAVVSRLPIFSDTFRSPAERFFQVTGQTNEVSTLDLRIRTVNYAWARILQEPVFGAGLDDQSGGTFDQFTLTHNAIVRSWFQGGLLLFVAFSIAYGVIVIAMVRAVRSTSGALPVAMITVVLAFSLTAAFFQQPAYWLPVLMPFTFLGLHASVTLNRREEGWRRLSPSK